MAYQNCYKFMSHRWVFPPKLVYSQGWPDVPDGTLCNVTPASGCTYTRATWPPRGRGRGESLASPRRIEAKLRVVEVLRLRRKGYTWQQIARVLGFRDASGPWRAARRAYDRLDSDRYRNNKGAINQS
jgi:hypothetical protein